MPSKNGSSTGKVKKDVQWAEGGVRMEAEDDGPRRPRSVGLVESTMNLAERWG